MSTHRRATAPVIHRLDVLPYWPVYATWTRHLNDCDPCWLEMSEDQEIRRLCPEGQELAVAVQRKLDQQHAAAQSN
jgi:hypothetical protein